MVESLCCASWGWCRITTCVLVGMGWAGRDSQRQTGLGREQLAHTLRRRGGGGGEDVEEVPEMLSWSSSSMSNLVGGASGELNFEASTLRFGVLY